MLPFYESIIRSVLEYACPAWHSSLTVEQNSRIEAIQRQSFKCNLRFIISPYENVRQDNPHVSLSDRQEHVCSRFYPPFGQKLKHSFFNFPGVSLPSRVFQANCIPREEFFTKQKTEFLSNLFSTSNRSKTSANSIFQLPKREV